MISFQVIEHIQDDISFVKEIYRVLKEEGMFSLTIPNRLYRLKPKEKPRNPFHVREYAPLDLQRLLIKIFNEANVFGIRGIKEVQEIEVNRTKDSIILKLDSLSLRRFLPFSFRRKVLRTLTGRGEISEDYINQKIQIIYILTMTVTLSMIV